VRKALSATALATLEPIVRGKNEHDRSAQTWWVTSQITTLLKLPIFSSLDFDQTCPVENGEKTRIKTV
jgi:hypothetical protein